jgi:N utilization substance protein B
MKRSDQRRAAVVALYQHDLTGRPVDELFEPDARPYTRGLAHATLDFQDELDEAIARHATGWSLNRIAPLERAILRTAALEVLHPELTIADKPIPPEGAIDEAVETAKRFCGSEAPGFVNGILSAILRSTRENGAVHG